MNAGRGLISELSDPRVHTESRVMTSPNIFVSSEYLNTFEYFRWETISRSKDQNLPFFRYYGNFKYIDMTQLVF